MANSELRVFYGTSHPELGAKIIKQLGIKNGDIKVSRFSGGEIYARINENVRGASCVIIQTCTDQVNSDLMELFIIIDAMKRASAKSVTAVIPHFGYARQDRKAASREPISARLVANLIEKAGADRVVAMDLHSDQIQGFFNIPVDTLTALPILANYIDEKKLKDMVVVAPDTGRAKVAKKLADRIGAIRDLNRGKRHQPHWYVKYRDVDGRWKMVPSRQPTKKQARRYVEQVEGRIAAGKIGIPEPTPDEVKRERITVKELADTFLRDYSSPRLKDVEKYRRDVRSILRNLTGPLGYMRVVDMGRAHLSRLRDEKLAAGLSKATVKLILAYTSRMFTWARTEGLIDVQNPVALVDKPSVAGQAMDFNFLSADEADRLLAWAREKQPKEYPAYATALYTGLRMGELGGPALGRLRP